MSRIGKNPVSVPEGVEVDLKAQEFKAKGKLGELSMTLFDGISAKLEDDDNGGKVISVNPKSKSKKDIAMWPTSRTLINNIVEGVSKGYTKELEISGIGYRAQLQGQTLVLQLGYSHDVRYSVPEGVKIELDGQTKIKVSGIDKQKVGQVAAEIKDFRPPEPYKGKGIKYAGEYILRKEGKKK